MNIGGLQKLTIIDFPGHIAAVIFLQGCNFRCPYCHNPELVDPKQFQETIDQNEVIASIKEFLDSIGESRNFAVISRGDTISITSVSGKPIERAPKPTGQMFSCAHCGHVTPYEVVHNMHVRIHYL